MYPLEFYIILGARRGFGTERMGAHKTERKWGKHERKHGKLWKNHREILEIVNFMEIHKNTKDHQIGEEQKLHYILLHSSLFSLHIHIIAYIYLHLYQYICLAWYQWLMMLNWRNIHRLIWLLTFFNLFFNFFWFIVL